MRKFRVHVDNFVASAVCATTHDVEVNGKNVYCRIPAPKAVVRLQLFQDTHVLAERRPVDVYLEGHLADPVDGSGSHHVRQDAPFVRFDVHLEIVDLSERSNYTACIET